jgi:glycosyltransferase involved in cell wall biosynthesis
MSAHTDLARTPTSSPAGAGPSPIVVLTPLAGGADGISEMTRQWVRALAAPADGRPVAIDVWSLDDDPSAAAVLPCGARLRTAAGRHLTYSTFALRPQVDPARTLVVAMHVHLAPVALPLVLRGAHLVVVLNGIEAWKPLTTLETMALRRAAAVVAISHHTVDRFRSANPDCDDVPVSVCHPAARYPASVSQGTPPKAPYALIVGRMSTSERYKGHDVLIDIWSQVRATCPTAALVVVGDGDDRARLEQKAAAQCPDGIVFEGRVPSARLETLYRGAVCLAMPSTHEGFGIVYAEAMARGVPCVACPGAAEEIVEHGRDGLVVPAVDPDALTRALVALFSDRDLRSRLAQGAARRAAEVFTERALRDRIAALIDLAGAA